MIKVYKESEKAIQIGMKVENTISEKDIVELVWIPKSQLDEKGFPKMWILNNKSGSPRVSFEERFGYKGHNGYELRGVEVE